MLKIGELGEDRLIISPANGQFRVRHKDILPIKEIIRGNIIMAEGGIIKCLVIMDIAITTVAVGGDLKLATRAIGYLWAMIIGAALFFSGFTGIATNLPGFTWFFYLYGI